jgi:membrane associated rhomboid family serine protease/antitoxin component YwqK of YwqJK toxin-antitoxin module
MRRPHVATLVLISLCVLMYFFTLGKGANWLLPEMGPMLNAGANFSGLTLNGEWWRLFTCMFIHFGVIHLAVNMLALYSLGRDLEEELGSAGLAFAFLACGFSASVSSLLFNDFTVSAGASGAIFGLFGIHFSYLLLGLAYGRKGFVRHLISALLMLAVNIILGLSVSIIDNAAHLGGFVAGLVMGSIYNFLLRTGQSRTFLVAFCAVIVVAGSTVLITSASRFPAWYYSMFSNFIGNEKEASRILENREHGSDDATFRTQLEEAKRLWSVNQQMVDSFPYAPARFAADLQVLHDYCLLKKRIMDLYLKSLDRDSYLFIDTVEYVNYEISRLPKLQYPLDLFSSPGKESDDSRLEPVTIYYNKEWKVTTRAGASYFRLAQKDSLQRINGLVKDYYADSTVQMKGYYTNDLKDGVFFYFYPNGWYESAGMYNHDVPVGKWQRFYPNRQIRLEERYDMGNHTVENFWTRDGVQLMSEGNGIYYEEYEDGPLKELGRYTHGVKDSVWQGFYHPAQPGPSKTLGMFAVGKTEYLERWSDGKLVSGTHYLEGGKTITYDQEYVEPTPEGGFENYMKFIREKTGYPYTKAKKYPEGTVIIELTVDVDGHIVEMEPYTKIGAGCEYQAMEVIKHGPKFHPALLRGVPVKEKVQIPFVYKLK